MNIGIFTDAYFPQINGVVISTKILKDALENIGHTVTIITVRDPNCSEDEEGILRLASIPFFALPSFRVGSFYSYKVMKSIKKLNLDIIHTQTEFSLSIFAKIVSRHLEIPIVHTYHTMYEDYSHYFSFKIIEKYAKLIARKFSKSYCNSVSNVVVPTQKVADALEDYGLKKHINIIPTGVNVKPFKSESYSTFQINSAKKSLGLNDKEPVLLFVGRIAKEKSIDIVIKSLPVVLKSVPNLKFVIIGEGPEKIFLEKLSQSLQLEDVIIFAGKRPWETIGLYYQVADIFISASTSETQGLTYIEAMAAKKVVIAKYDTNLDGVIIDHFNGRFFYEDYQLSNLIIDVLEDDLLRYYLSKNASEIVTSMSSEQFAVSVESIYQETIDKQYARNYLLS